LYCYIVTLNTKKPDCCAAINLGGGVYNKAQLGVEIEIELGDRCASFVVSHGNKNKCGRTHLFAFIGFGSNPVPPPLKARKGKATKYFFLSPKLKYLFLQEIHTISTAVFNNIYPNLHV